MLTSTGEYAVRAMIHIAERPQDGYILAHEIGSDLDLPERYLSKILGTLTRKRLLEARRGRGGGFRLRKNPEKITIYEILDTVDRTAHFQRCILGYQTCDDRTPCTIHVIWKEFRQRILKLLQTVTLAEIVSGEVDQEMAFGILKMPCVGKNPRGRSRAGYHDREAGGVD